MMPLNRGRVALVALAVTLLLAAVATAAVAPTVPATLTGSISPDHLLRPTRGGVGQPLTLKIRSVLNHPADSRLQLQKVLYKLPGGSAAVANGRFFPSCTAEAINRARGSLRVCPRGSKIGRGIATGTAVDIGVTSSGKLTLFNGPGGRSITLNVSILNPALINLTFSVPLRKTSGRYGYTTSAVVPPDLQTILDGPIVVRRIDLTTGATIMVRGVRRGYIEGFRCPRGGRAPLHGEFSFSDGSVSLADTSITCRQ